MLERNVAAWSRLAAAEQLKLQADIQVFVREKFWEGCGGLSMTDEVKVTVAAEACRMVLAFSEEYYDEVQSILVYPNAYRAPTQTVRPGGVVIEGESPRVGEAWYRGPVILSWPEVLSGARHQAGGDSLVLHEFAHQLDMQNGRDADGIPVLESAELVDGWQRVMNREFRRLVRDCRQGKHTLLSCYGATSPSEFFAVASERFFVKPRELRIRHAELYDVLREFYLQDPAERL